MKKLLAILLSLCLALTLAAAEETETLIVLGETITVNGAAISGDASAAVYLVHQVEVHGDVPAELQGMENNVVTIAAAGTYRISGTAADTQIAVRAGAEDDVRLILDGVDITCRTSSAIAVYSARDPRTAGEYAVTIELADGSENRVTGSHTVRIEETDTKLDGAICSLVSLGFEGAGKLTVDADNEGVEVKYGHMTINGGVLDIQSGDDPLNVSEDGVGVLTMNDGYVFSAVRNAVGGEGDGIDSNGWIIFNGGTAINLAHPTSQDSGIDSDMGSSINGGVIVGAGNMYDPIEADSRQLFMMLEFAESTDDLLVVTDKDGNPVFAYDFPYDYMYIAFSTPELKDGETYHVYLGGEIVGEQHNGLYTTINAYTPGKQMKHGEGNAEQRITLQMPSDMGAFDPMQDRQGMGGEIPAMPGSGQMGAPMEGQGMGQQGTVPGSPNGQMGAMGQQGGAAPGAPAGQMGVPMADMGGMMEAANALATLDLNEILKDVDLNELLKDVDLNDLLTGVAITDLLTEAQIRQYLGDVDVTMLEQAIQMSRGFGGMGGGMRGLQSSADVATTEFVLTRETTGFTNVSAVDMK